MVNTELLIPNNFLFSEYQLLVQKFFTSLLYNKYELIVKTEQFQIFVR